MTDLATPESSRPIQTVENIIEWTTNDIYEAYVGRLSYVPLWKESDTNTHSPYVKDALHLVSDVVVNEEDDSISFLMTKLEPSEATYDSKERVRLVNRVGPPDEIIIKPSREIWVYGDRSAQDDQTLSFKL